MLRLLSGRRLPGLHPIVEQLGGIRHLVEAFISTAESALAGIAALVLVGSAPEPSHTKHEPRLSCRACGTCLHGRNAPGNNRLVRHVPTPRRYAPDRPPDH